MSSYIIVQIFTFREFILVNHYKPTHTMSRLLLLISMCLLLSCGEETNDDNQNKPKTTLIEHVKLAINP